MSDEPSGHSPPDHTKLEEAAPTVEPLDGRRGPRWMRARLRRSWWARALLPGLLMALLAGVAANGVFTPALSSLRTALGPRPTATPHIPEAGEGWTPAGPAGPDGGADRIAFAPGSPTIAYACGADTDPRRTHLVPVRVYVSRDRGEIWQPLPTLPPAAWCDLSINPADPHDVLLAAYGCFSCYPPPVRQVVYRSRDGGLHWDGIMLPPLSARPEAVVQYIRWAWAGGTLFLAATFDGERSSRHLAASRNGGPIEWVEQNGLFADDRAHAQINGLLGGAAAVYIQLVCGNAGCSGMERWMMRSGDGGATWTSLAGAAKWLLDVSVDGRALLGQMVFPGREFQGDVARSTDDGATWTVLPRLHPSLRRYAIFQVPDGTIFVDCDDSAPDYPMSERAANGVYALAPGATAWRLVAPRPAPNRGVQTASWDEAGHLTALWGMSADPQRTGLVVFHLR